MTAINVILHPTAAYLMTDGLCWNKDGSQNYATTKVVIIAHINAALAVSGNYYLLHGLANIIGIKSKSFDHATSILGSELKALMAGLAMNGLELPAEQVPQAFLVGISESTAAPSARVVFGKDKQGYKAFESYNLKGCISPAVGNETAFTNWCTDVIASQHSDHSCFNPFSDGLQLMEAQRQVSDTKVGAFCQLTSITREFITSRILHRWDEDTATP